MTPAQLNRQVADITGETISEIRHRGFSLHIVPEHTEATEDNSHRLRRRRQHRRRRPPSCSGTTS